MDPKQTSIQPVQPNINLNIDTTPVLYSDHITWGIQEDMIVLNFGQTIMNTNQIKIVSRISLGKKFFRKVIEDIGKKIVLSEFQGESGRVRS